jgi:hypothetical protein
MQRINTANAAANLFGVGKSGFQGGNPAANLPATFLSPDWCNAVQEELAQAIEGLGLTINSGSNNQLLAALLAYFTPQSQFAGEIGKVSHVPAMSASVNHVPCFGVELARVGPYAALWAFAQSSGALVDEATFPSRPGCFGYGPGGVGGTTFRVPKMPGLVIKAYHNNDGTYTTNTSALIGAYLPDEIKWHDHGVPWGAAEGNNTSNATNGDGTAGFFPTQGSGGTENTVRSVILFPQIRYR